MKRQATMASKTSKAEPITLEELGARIARRRAELGIIDADIPRNSGAPHGEQEGAVEGNQSLRNQQVIRLLHSCYRAMLLSNRGKLNETQWVGGTKRGCVSDLSKFIAAAGRRGRAKPQLSDGAG